MPTILVLYLFYWAGGFSFMQMKEMNRFMCIAEKLDMECKYWIDEDNFDIYDAYSYGLTPQARKQIRKIIFEHFDYIVDQWGEFQERR